MSPMCDSCKSNAKACGKGSSLCEGATPEEKRAVFEGFEGAFVADSVDILGRYVNGVSAEAAGH